MCDFVVLGFSIPSQQIGLGKRLRNSRFCVEWDVKPQLSQSIMGFFVNDTWLVVIDFMAHRLEQPRVSPPTTALSRLTRDQRWHYLQLPHLPCRSLTIRYERVVLQEPNTIGSERAVHTHPFNGPFPGLPRWAGTRKVKPIWILLKQETVIGSGISWAICKSTLLQTDNHASTPLLSFLQAGCPSCYPTNSV